jgi:hypothetical protein
VGSDIEHSHPEARDDIIKWGKWVIDEIGACGFRFDAVKVSSFAFPLCILPTSLSYSDSKISLSLRHVIQLTLLPIHSGENSILTGTSLQTLLRRSVMKRQNL